MLGRIAAYIIWLLIALAIIGMGLISFFTKKKKALDFYNIGSFPVNDIRGYNKAQGVLFIGYGGVFAFLGLPLLAGQNNPYVIFSVLGVMVETIVLMIIFLLVIDKKYRKK